MSGWLRRNRIGLALLPVALVAAAAGNAHRIQTWFWENDLRAAQRAGADGVVRFVDMYDDGNQRHPIRPALSLDAAEPVTAIDPGDGEPITPRLAAGTRLWRVTIKVEADPDMILSGCQLALADSTGTRWKASDKAFDDGEYSVPDPCTPPGRPGPSWLPNTPGPVVAADAVRPPSYHVTTYLAIPSTAQPSEVWVWWSEPRYAVLPIPS